MPETVHRSHVIADRYLTSPAALAAQPFGPVDALDTHSGRGAQVRIVFVAGEYDEADLADAVARWCGIGCSEVCGVLDFGRHGDRWFLVLPPSVGLPVERWRMLRRPTAADAARLTLAFGRLTERVAAAGFSPDAAALADVAVGPGPTPFLERPLLPRRPPTAGRSRATASASWPRSAMPRSARPIRRPACTAGASGRAPEQFASLGECLDELERSRAAGDGHDAPASDLPPGMGHLFDDDFDLDGPAVTAPPPRRVRRFGRVLSGCAHLVFSLADGRSAGSHAREPGLDNAARSRRTRGHTGHAPRPARRPEPARPHAADAPDGRSPRRAHHRHHRACAAATPPHHDRGDRRPVLCADHDLHRRCGATCRGRLPSASFCRPRERRIYHGSMRSPSSAELDLYARAQAASVHAYVPYSRFAVGAALLPEGGGEPVTAVNVENASYGLTVCAERNAVFTAVAAGHRRFDAIAVYAEADSVPPCGACRQVLAEFAPAIAVVFRRGGEVVTMGLDELLPERFRL